MRVEYYGCVAGKLLLDWWVGRAVVREVEDEIDPRGLNRPRFQHSLFLVAKGMDTPKQDRTEIL